MYISLLCACACLWQFCTAHYTQQWALHISGGRDVADQVAKDHGFTNVGEVSYQIIALCFSFKK